MSQIDCHPAQSDEDGAPDNISDTKHCLDWNGYLDNANNTEDNCKEDNESNVEPDNRMEHPETP